MNRLTKSGILATRLRLYSRRNIHTKWLHRAHGFGNIVRGQAAGEGQLALLGDLGGDRPVEGSAGATGHAGNAGVEEDMLAGVHSCELDGGAVLYGDGFVCIGQERGEQLGRLCTMQLGPADAGVVQDFANLLQSEIDEYPNGLDTISDGLDDRAGGPSIDASGRGRPEVEADRIDAPLDATQCVVNGG